MITTWQHTLAPSHVQFQKCPTLWSWLIIGPIPPKISNTGIQLSTNYNYIFRNDKYYSWNDYFKKLVLHVIDFQIKIKIYLNFAKGLVKSTRLFLLFFDILSHPTPLPHVIFCFQKKIAVWQYTESYIHVWNKFKRKINKLFYLAVKLKFCFKNIKILVTLHSKKSPITIFLLV